MDARSDTSRHHIREIDWSNWRNIFIRWQVRLDRRWRWRAWRFERRRRLGKRRNRWRFERRHRHGARRNARRRLRRGSRIRWWIHGSLFAQFSEPSRNPVVLWKQLLHVGRKLLDDVGYLLGGNEVGQMRGD
jgi:hypothetical protein